MSSFLLSFQVLDEYGLSLTHQKMKENDQAVDLDL